MTSLPRRSATRREVHDPAAPAAPAVLATLARCVLSCPAGVNLVVDGIDDVLADLDDPERGVPGRGGLGMQDLDGVPTFSCPTGTRLVGAAHDRRRALLTLESGLGRAAATSPGSERDLVLTLGGRLEHRGQVSCECCTEVRDTVVLVVDVVVLTRPSTGGRLQVDVDHFRAAGHALNRGYLQRAAEHADLCHQDELRRAVATTTGTRLAEVVGVSLADLSPTGVELRWVDPTGSHARRLDFGRTATSSDELGELLRSTLHAGLC